ncbi:iron-containing alcohol dehydrogenase family protein [Haliovirga abyssi]|uniref:Glycerol dehydrogenase n=1 Tax=Haliovirga abyssi TaxID=2996794 RepID=A0AAU9DNS4_9FUSO|nr:iron-containing alcohol dehydrogenase family protein [Haliovirga abyssi]BDU50023.1 glycerol dehydrogenase [Haliovirga abyssi]
MTDLLIAPENYISGYDIIDELGAKVKKIAKKVLVLSDEKVYKIVEKGLNSLENSEIIYTKEYFNGECCFTEIDRISNILKENGYDAIVGIGGGKILDTVKTAGYKAGVKIITVPTIAATCAAWSSHSAIYTDDGISYEYFNIHKNADLLFLDKKIVFEAPVRYIKAGILDTLAKWVETKSSTLNLENKNVATEIAIYLAKKTYKDMFEFSKIALENIEKKEYTKDIDIVIEDIIFTAGLVGGIGGEACRAVAAHAINNGFTIYPDTYNKNLHGEVVGFGNVVQMIMDKRDNKEINDLVKLYKEIEADVSLKGMGFEDLSDIMLEKIVNKSLYKGDTIWNAPYKVEFEMVKEAILKANEIILKGEYK